MIDDLKDALTGGDDDQEGIKVHEHYDNLSVKQMVITYKSRSRTSITVKRQI